MKAADNPPRRLANAKTDKRGRYGRRAKQGNPATGPKQCGVEQWGWYPLELLGTPAFQTLSRNARLVLDRVLWEHIAQGGMSNGELRISHTDFCEAGVTRNQVATAVRENEAAGVLRVRRRGKIAGRNAPNLYRLTWMGGWGSEGQMIQPSNDWKKARAEDVKQVRKRAASGNSDGPSSKVVPFAQRKKSQPPN